MARTVGDFLVGRMRAWGAHPPPPNHPPRPPL